MLLRIGPCHHIVNISQESFLPAGCNPPPSPQSIQLHLHPTKSMKTGPLGSYRIIHHSQIIMDMNADSSALPGLQYSTINASSFFSFPSQERERGRWVTSHVSKSIYLPYSNPVKRYSDIQVIKIATIIHPRTRKKNSKRHLCPQSHSLQNGPDPGPSPPFIYPMAYYPLAPFSKELPTGYASTTLSIFNPISRKVDHMNITIYQFLS